MSPIPVKKYTVTGSSWSNLHLELQQDGLPILYINSNNKYGPWYVGNGGAANINGR
jgi:hypothetical protein